MGMYYFEVLFGWPTLLAALAAIASTTLFSVLVGASTFVPAVLRLPSSSMLVLTAGLLTFFSGVTLLVWGNQPYALPPFSGEAPVVLGSLRVPSQGLWLAAVAVAIIVGLWLLLQRTTLGRALRACAETRPPHG
jgi:branched-chain amino acid transport system permease protein